MSQLKGTIFDFKQFSINDGPGTRTTVFFKGCPLSCLWCHNPESRSSVPQLIYYRDKCIGCQFCVKVCPVKAIEVDGLGVAVDMSSCTVCGNCVKVCPSEALEVAGISYAVEDVMDIVMKDALFYEDSGGGVTFSGGEPLQQKVFLRELLCKCQETEIHTAVDTTGFVPLEDLKYILPMTDLFLYDIKHMNSEKHKEMSGVPNELILGNLKALSEAGANISIRIPVIPGINDGDNLVETAEFVATLNGVVSVDLLPYHNIMMGKYERLGMDYLLDDICPPDASEIEAMVHIFKSKNLTVTVGG